MILQAIPQISTNAWYFTGIPLSFIIGLGILKEGLADLKRYQQDKLVNNSIVVKV
jgi:phospholipid-translocating ATPase